MRQYSRVGGNSPSHATPTVGGLPPGSGDHWKSNQPVELCAGKSACLSSAEVKRAKQGLTKSGQSCAQYQVIHDCCQGNTQDGGSEEPQSLRAGKLSLTHGSLALD